MSAQPAAAPNTAFKIGWIVLLILSALMALNHIVLIFVIRDQATLFVGWTGFNLYSTLVLYIPFRRGEKWAWYTTWVMAAAFISLIFFDTQIGLYYFGAGVIMALCLLLTRPAFFHGAPRAN